MDKVILKIQNIDFSINSLPILQNINYEVSKGDFIILLGSNGSGKSTLLKIIDKRYSATNGSVSLNGTDINNYSQKDFYKSVVTITQNCTESLFPSLTVLENYKLLGNDNYDKLSSKLDVCVNNLSGGEQQALSLALSILNKPQILLLDEHTSALDPQSAHRLMELTDKTIKENNITCILSTHNLDVALKYGNKILALKNGKIFKTINSLEEKQIIKHQDLLSKCY